MILLYCSSRVSDDAEREYSFLFCRPGEKQWRLQKLSPDIQDIISRRGHSSVLCFKGKLYLMFEDNRYVEEHQDDHLEIEHFTNNTGLAISIKTIQVKKEEDVFPSIGKAYIKSHYVETHDELFRVDIIDSRSCWEVISVKVARLNFSLMEWEKVNSLGDNVLFIGCNTTACSSSTELGFTRGCLLWFDDSLHKFEIESTANTVTLAGLQPIDQFYDTDWVLMPTANVYGRRVANTLGGKHEENGISMALEETSTTMAAVVHDEKQWGKCLVGEVEVAISYWNNLNDDIVGLIVQYLHGVDYTHFRSVCKANRATMPEVNLTPYSSPWLVFCKDHIYNIFSVVNPMYNNAKYVMNLADLAGSTIRFQKSGWLLMTRKHSIFFYNPFTRETVKLPGMDRDCYFSVVSFSSLPTSSDCIVFVMDRRHDGFYIDFIRRGEAHWSSHIFDSKNIAGHFLDTAVFHDGAFFSADIYNRAFGVFNVHDNSWKVLEKPDRQCELHHPCFLVECGEDVLLVKLGESLVRICKLNFSAMEWVEVESLGEHMIFISHTSCVSAVAPNSNMKNNIHIPRLHLNNGGIVYYSLETRRYHSVGSKQTANNLSDTQGWYENCTWIEPNRSMSTAEELNWLKAP